MAYRHARLPFPAQWIGSKDPAILPRRGMTEVQKKAAGLPLAAF
jgi:hypothetical protein